LYDLKLPLAGATVDLIAVLHSRHLGIVINSP
jgi:hypothetical protein